MLDFDEFRATAETAYLLTVIGRSTNRRLAEFLGPTQIKPRAMDAMIALRNGSLAQNVLGETLGVHAVTLITILNELESAGLVVRRRDVGDRRRHSVSLTELGRARLAAVDIAREHLDATLFAGMSGDDRALLTTLLERVAHNLELPTSDPYRCT